MYNGFSRSCPIVQQASLIPGQLHIRITYTVRLYNRPSRSCPVVQQASLITGQLHIRIAYTLSGSITSLVDPIRLYIQPELRLHIGIPGCITGHRRAWIDQQDVPLCNWISGCITGIPLCNRLGWSSVQNIYILLLYIIVANIHLYRK